MVLLKERERDVERQVPLYILMQHTLEIKIVLITKKNVTLCAAKSTS